MSGVPSRQERAIGSKPDWLRAGFDDAACAHDSPPAWNMNNEDLKDYHGTGLYRARFTQPAEWRGRRVVLNLYNFDTPIVYDVGEFFATARRSRPTIRGWSQTYAYDVTDKLQAGDNILAVRVKGGSQFSGLGGGNLASGRAQSPTRARSCRGWQIVSPARAQRGPSTCREHQGKIRRPRRADTCLVARAELFLHIESETQWLAGLSSMAIPFH